MLDNSFTQNVPLPQRKKWLNDADNILASIDRSEDTDQSWSQSLVSTAALLRQAHKIIAQSEQRIQELERLSSTDELTGITNRRGFMREFDRELDRVNRDKSQGGLLIMIDLDNFKMINDTYGHAVGDMALKIVSSTLASDIRTMDIVARLGGDEFVILFANTTRKDALERAQFLIKKLNSLSFIWHGEEINVRASLGLQEYKKGSKAKNIFTAADADMYENKKQLKQLGLRKQNTRMV
jgi:diguanylate cyclase (GGDEF)-like protein